ncbi:galactokinase [Novosphingobium kunmingense]|uniref:Galactokinase n=1 Tax=Novosphingobium kunmingense TaxID=1211806 RepID=A0A2N0H3F7_9SPHN|nr:galactokinase [Novosphingobium kunmingense]PKB13473.1 galactokinase [Novosphingobium kunmingense]
MSLIERTRTGFSKAYGHSPSGVAFAPGRVNLIGEHVDYNDGLVLPMPIAAGTAVAWSLTDDADVEALALDYGLARDRFDPKTAEKPALPGWQSYVRGMAQLSGHAGVKLAIAGSIPRGSGLSSSASLCVAVGQALAAARGPSACDPLQIARAAQHVEHRWAGVNCGIMDQMAIAAGQPGAALLLDCRSLETRRIDLPEDWDVMIVQSGVVRGLVEGHYNARRRDCEAAAAALGVASLRDADAAMVGAADLDPVVRRRAIHVVEEIARVRTAVDAIEARDLTGLGATLRASHASLRDLFAVSVPAVDTLVDQLNKAIGQDGGARMTGGGFGGAVVAILPSDAAVRVRAQLERDYRSPDGAAIQIMIERAGTLPAGTMR